MNIQEPSVTKGKLYLVSTPIGNKDDITLRAINTIKRCDLIVCEEMKMGALALKNLNLAKEMLPLNENNESEMTVEVINMLKEGKKIALISDAGTPVFADPGLYLVKQAILHNLDIEVVPGASSIMTAIVRSGFELYEFLYAGFLPRKNEDRDRRLQKLARERRTVVIFDTPYRLIPLLEACANAMPNRKAYIAMNLTMLYETHHYGTFSELFKKFENTNTKSEFVIVMEGNKEWIEQKAKNAEIEGYIDDDEDDDEPVVYEYPVKAHQKLPEKNKKIIKAPARAERPFSSTAGGSRYQKDRPSGGGSKFGRDRNSSSGDSYGQDRTPAGAPTKFGKERSSSSYSEGRRYSSDRNSGTEGRRYSSDRSSSSEGSRFSKDGPKRKDFGGKPDFKKSYKPDGFKKNFGDSNSSGEERGKTDFSDNRRSIGDKFKSKSSGKFKGNSNGGNRSKW
jgi:16S rRNA (cytidine1402-2'-O)-methyltransferase